MTKTIVAFGNFNLHGARSWVIRTGLQESGYEIRLCRTEVKGLVSKYVDLWRRWKQCRDGASAIYVVFLGHYLMPLAWLLGKRSKIPVIFDAFLSLYDTEVSDRARVSKFSPRAWILWLTDWISCRLADVILIDTEENRKYFVNHYGVPAEKILVLPVGCRSDLFQSGVASTSTDAGKFNIEFHGTYIPLQGIETILGAARELQEHHPDIIFTLIGSGQTHGTMTKMAADWNLQNVRFIRSVPIAELPAFVQAADVCLGIFGTTAKADRVIPNKAYEAIACGKALITGRTTAVQRVFRDRENVLLCSPGDPHALAESILVLKNDSHLRTVIAQGGLELTKRNFGAVEIVRLLKEWMNSKIF